MQQENKKNRIKKKLKILSNLILREIMHPIRLVLLRRGLINSLSGSVSC